MNTKTTYLKEDGTREAIREYDKEFAVWFDEVAKKLGLEITDVDSPKIRKYDPYGSFDSGKSAKTFVAEVEGRDTERKVRLKELDFTVGVGIDPFNEENNEDGWETAKKHLGKVGVAEYSGEEDVWLVTFGDGKEGAFVEKELEFLD